MVHGQAGLRGPSAVLCVGEALAVDSASVTHRPQVALVVNARDIHSKCLTATVTPVRSHRCLSVCLSVCHRMTEKFKLCFSAFLCICRLLTSTALDLLFTTDTK